jgi:hypothetical protein
MSAMGLKLPSWLEFVRRAEGVAAGQTKESAVVAIA